MSGRRSLVALVSAEAISLTGTRLSMIALPWFVLITTNSATRTGLVVFSEMAPYVVAKTLGGPMIDRVGARRVSVGADLVSAVLVAGVPVLHGVGALHFWVLLGLVAMAGAVRGPGDTAKSALVPDVATAAGVPLERVTGLRGTAERLATTVGPAVAGAVVAGVGPLNALLIDAASFGVAAILIQAIPRRGDVIDRQAPVEAYVRRLGQGLAFIRQARLLRTIVTMVALTNLLDAAMFSVLLPVWAKEMGRGPAAIGAVASAMSLTAVGGSILATLFGDRLPRRAIFLAGFLIGGAPRFIVLAGGADLWPVIAVHLAAGFGAGFLNPILGAVILERIPRDMLGRVSGLAGSLAWVGIPFGGLVGGTLVAVAGLSPALLICGGAYFAATTLPAFGRDWHDMDVRGGGLATA
jgi:MFS family permease